MGNESAIVKENTHFCKLLAFLVTKKCNCDMPINVVSVMSGVCGVSSKCGASESAK